MKVLLISRRFQPFRCGVGDYTAELARFLLHQGHDVCVLTEPTAEPRSADVRLIEQHMRGWRDLPQVLRTICGEKPSVVQLEYSQYGWSRWGCAFWLNALLVALRLRAIPVKLALHEFPILFRQHPKQAMSAALQRVHFWLLCAAASDVLTNTAERVAILRCWFPWRKRSLHYRPNSNCNPVFPCSGKEREVIRRERGVAPGELVAAVYGLFATGKGTDVVIQAVIHLQQQVPLHLWMIGDPSQANPAYMARLRQLAEPLGGRVWWSGALSQKDVSHHLQAVDIFLLPQADGHLTRSSSFMAAAAHGLPVVAVRNPANQAEFTHGTDVLLVDKSSASHFAEAVRALAFNADLRNRLGANLMSLYGQKFDWPARVHSSAEQPLGSLPQESREQRVLSPARARK